jgi:hypothetical protein
LFEAIPKTSISSNKQNKKWPSRQNKKGEKKKNRDRRMANREREPEHREYKRDPIHMYYLLREREKRLA